MNLGLLHLSGGAGIPEWLGWHPRVPNTATGIGPRQQVDQIHFEWDNSAKDREGDERCLALDLDDGCYSTDERSFRDEHLVTRQVRSLHFTSLPPGGHRCAPGRLKRPLPGENTFSSQPLTSSA
jgi:hypothetical protein